MPCLSTVTDVSLAFKNLNALPARLDSFVIVSSASLSDIGLAPVGGLSIKTSSPILTLTLARTRLSKWFLYLSCWVLVCVVAS